MINLSSMRSLNRRTHIISMPILAISILLAAIFIASCGDEGDTTEDTTGMTDVLQPTTTPSETPPPPPVEGQPPAEEVVEEPGVSFQEDIQPILASECAIAGCHAAPGAAGLDLSAYDTFKRAETAVLHSSQVMAKAALWSNALTVAACPLADPRWMGTKSKSSLTGLMKVPKITKVSHSIPLLFCCVKLKRLSILGTIHLKGASVMRLLFLR